MPAQLQLPPDALPVAIQKCGQGDRPLMLRVECNRLALVAEIESHQKPGIFVLAEVREDFAFRGDGTV